MRPTSLATIHSVRFESPTWRINLQAPRVHRKYGKPDRVRDGTQPCRDSEFVRSAHVDRAQERLRAYECAALQILLRARIRSISKRAVDHSLRSVRATFASRTALSLPAWHFVLLWMRVL